MSGIDSGTLPARLPDPTELNNSADVDGYLRSVSAMLLEDTGATLVGIYLMDRATGRLAVRAWATAAESGVSRDNRVPSELGDHGIDGDELEPSTLRDYIHAAPPDERIAVPIHDGESWVGALVGQGSFGEAAPTVFHDAASQLAALLRSSAAPIGDHIVAETEAAIDLPSDAILGDSSGDGVAVGPAMLFRSVLERTAGTAKVEESREGAVARLDRAIDATRAELERLLDDLDSDLYDVVSLIFSTHVLMLTDEAFSGEMRSLVESGQAPEDAVQTVVASFVRTFRNLREARLAEKAQDVRDIGQRILANLSVTEEGRASASGDDFTGHIVIAEDLLPSDLVRFAMGHASGVVIIGATITAHISILAQSLGLPVLMTTDRRALEIAPRAPLLLDAASGRLLITPTAEQLIEYGTGTVPPATAARVRAGVGQRRRARCETADHARVTLLANVNLLNDARRAAALGADGIGLYRSEFPFIIRNDYVSEDEQRRVYRTIVESMAGRPVVLRTADIGGDKLLAGREEERNPFLGVRGIRFSLANRELFREQLRAMLRAGHDADLHIMFPMVSSVEEIEDARVELARCIDELAAGGVTHHPAPKVGAMVELPSAVVTIEEFAAATDFLSIGTNDLIMYLLAVDRTNERLGELYRSHHPVVLRTLADIARRVGDRVAELSVCGESAADPLMIPFYLGIGIRKLSVAPRRLDRVRAVVASYSLEAAAGYAARILQIRTLREMDRFFAGYEPPRVA